MRDLRDLIDKRHDLGLQHLCVLGEVADVAEAEHCVSALAFGHWVQLALSSHVVRDDGRARLPEAECKQVADLGDCRLEEDSLQVVRVVLILLVVLVFLLMHHGHDAGHLDLVVLGRGKGVARNKLDFLQHALDWVEHQVRGCLLEKQD